MLFNSYEFILAFLPITLAGFFLLGAFNIRAATLWLTLASFGFYSWWSIHSLPLLLTSIAFNFAVGYGIAASPQRAKRLLVLGVSVNLVGLAIFKYADFLIGSLNHLTGSSLPFPGLELPIGISFFTFTQIAYLVDAYRRLAEDRDPLRYALFVNYFPHLIAGPILHHKQMMSQFAGRAIYRLNPENVALGLFYFAVGLFKKVVIADGLAPYANAVFKAADAGVEPTVVAAWIGALCYTFQLYFDFSGYSDMAVGISLMFNVRIPINFWSPYRSLSITEFWRRWHISLSTFLRDYLYIPLGGNRRGPARRNLNLFLTMVLGGLWHGAGWTFVAWGAMHGSYLLINHAWQSLVGHRLIAIRSLAGWPLTFLAVVAAWVVFRAETIGGAGRVLAAMAGYGVEWPFILHAADVERAAAHGMLFVGDPILETLYSHQAVLLLPLAMLTAFFLPNSHQIARWVQDRAAVPIATIGTLAGASAMAALLILNRPSQFLYFQF